MVVYQTYARFHECELVKPAVSHLPNPKNLMLLLIDFIQNWNTLFQNPS